MPLRNQPAQVRAAIDNALRTHALSQSDADAVLAKVRQDGTTRTEVNEILEALGRALAPAVDGLDLTTDEKKNVVAGLLGALDREQPSVARLLGGLTPPSDGLGYLEILKSRSQRAGELLAVTSFGGQKLSVDAEGELLVGDRKPVLDLSAPTDALIEGLWGLSRPGQVAGAATAQKQALTRRLAAQLQAALQVPDATDPSANDEGTCRRHQAITAALGALVQLHDEWDATVIPALLDCGDKVKSPLQKALLKRNLDAAAATLTAEQKLEVAAIEVPATAIEVARVFDDVLAGRARADYQEIKGSATTYALAGLCFAADKAATDNLWKAMGAWRKLSGSYVEPWPSESLRVMLDAFEQYVDSNGKLSYVFGALSEEVPKQVAAIISQRVVDTVAPGLAAEPPKLGDFPLTREQANYIQSIVATLRDTRALEELGACLSTVAALSTREPPSRWGAVAAPKSVLGDAAFLLFKRAADAYQAKIAENSDGKLGYNDLRERLFDQVTALRLTLVPRTSQLELPAAKWENISVTPEAATYLRDLLQTRLRSKLTIENLGRAVAVVAAAHSGAIDAAALTTLQAAVSEYVAGFAAGSVLDFNKLERFAASKVAGKAVPQCTVNGEAVSLGDVYDRVGRVVRDAIDPALMPASLRRPWIADRWGQRAKLALQVLDGIAEQSTQNLGAIAELRKKYAAPEHTIEVQFTGLDGDHEQLIYVVKKQALVVDRFNQGSDGTLAKYRSSNITPVFTATVGADGEVAVRVETTALKPHGYPLQVSYGVGDKVDFPWRDPEGVDKQREGETFSLLTRLLEAEITSYDAAGNYSVTYKTPSGAPESKTVALREIRRNNNPHWFKLQGDYFSDVNLNTDSDEELKKFIEDARPIITRHLPSDGTLVGLSPEEISARQRECIKALQHYTAERVKYPRGKDEHPDDLAKKYHELDARGTRFALGELVKIQRGVCRHQCILEHVLLQEAGIDSRLASGAANTSDGKFRAYHIWCEVTLADGERFLSDQTWDDPAVPLWSGAYGVDLRRIEMANRTAMYDDKTVNC